MRVARRAVVRALRSTFTFLFVATWIYTVWPSAFWFPSAVETAHASTAVIASAGTIAHATKNSQQIRIFYDGTRWWAFYMKSGTANTLFYSYSSNLTTWTEASVALNVNTGMDGGSITVYFDSGSNTLLATNWTGSGTDYNYIRGVISGTSIAWSSVIEEANTTKNANSDWTASLTTDSNNKMVGSLSDGAGNPSVYRSTNAISASFSDSVWGAVGTMPSVTDLVQRTKAFSLGGGNLLNMLDDLSGGNKLVRWTKWGGSSWTAYATIVSNAGASRTDWDAIRISDTDIRFLGVSAASTFSFQKFDGSSWSTLTAPAWPTGGLTASSGVSLISDGTNVWTFVIRGDANNSVSYNKYNGSAWGGWTDLVTTNAVRTDIQTAPVIGNNTIPVLWTQTNGSNFAIVVNSISALPPQGIQVSSRSDSLSDSRPSATSSHTFAFTVNNSIVGSSASNSSTLTLIFDPAFQLPVGMDCGDVDAATSVQFNFNYPGCAATATAWGFSATGSVITLVPPSGTGVYVPTSTQVTIKIGSNATVGQQGSHWITNPSTVGMYTISVGGTFNGSGNILISLNVGVTVQATVAESLALTVSSVAAVNCTADDGASVTAIGTTSTTIPFGNVSLNTFYIGCQDLVVSTNAGNGYSITTQESYAMKTANGSFTIPDTTCDAGTCSESAAAAWTSATHNGLGHTCFNQDGNHDCDSSYTNGTKFRQFANIAAGETPQAIMASSTPASVTARIKHRLSVGNAQAAGTYTTLITYTILGTF